MDESRRQMLRALAALLALAAITADGVRSISAEWRKPAHLVARSLIDFNASEPTK